MAERDNVIDLCNPDDVPGGFPEIGMTLLPRRAMVWMHNPETTTAGIYLPVSGRCRPDVGRLMRDYQGIPAGTIVAVAPYRGAWFDHEGGEYRLFGVSEYADEAIVMLYDGEWLPAPGWLMVRPDKREGVILGVDTARGTGTDVQSGERVVWDQSAKSYDVPMLGVKMVKASPVAVLG